MAPLANALSGLPWVLTQAIGDAAPARRFGEHRDGEAVRRAVRLDDEIGRKRPVADAQGRGAAARRTPSAQNGQRTPGRPLRRAPAAASPSTSPGRTACRQEIGSPRGRPVMMAPRRRTRPADYGPVLRWARRSTSCFQAWRLVVRADDQPLRDADAERLALRLPQRADRRLADAQRRRLEADVLALGEGIGVALDLDLGRAVLAVEDLPHLAVDRQTVVLRRSGAKSGSSRAGSR